MGRNTRKYSLGDFQKEFSYNLNLRKAVKIYNHIFNHHNNDLEALVNIIKDNINNQDKYNNTILYYAIKYGHENLVEHLLKTYRNIVIYKKIWSKIFELAFDHTNPNENILIIVSDHLQDTKEIINDKSYKNTIIHKCIELGYFNCLRILLNHKNANVNSQNDEGKYPINLLVKYKIMSDTNQLKSGMHKLSGKEFSEFISIMIQRYVKLDAKDQWEDNKGELLRNVVRNYPINQTIIDSFTEGFNKGLNLLKKKARRSSKDKSYSKYAEKWLKKANVWMKDLKEYDDLELYNNDRSSEKKKSDLNLLGKEEGYKSYIMIEKSSFRDKENNINFNNKGRY